MIVFFFGFLYRSGKNGMLLLWRCYLSFRLSPGTAKNYKGEMVEIFNKVEYLLSLQQKIIKSKSKLRNMCYNHDNVFVNLFFTTLFVRDPESRKAVFFLQALFAIAAKLNKIYLQST